MRLYFRVYESFFHDEKVFIDFVGDRLPASVTIFEQSVIDDATGLQPRITSVGVIQIIIELLVKHSPKTLKKQIMWSTHVRLINFMCSR